MDNLNTLQ
jgi:hypothetical protein